MTGKINPEDIAIMRDINWNHIVITGNKLDEIKQSILQNQEIVENLKKHKETCLATFCFCSNVKFNSILKTPTEKE
ncbi:MAG TPA: hypothetical protein VLE21_04765 [Candidatus Nitrosocosmicus sp.]|nr:hypothetical protein [Candidatus Nitrosocosmicus sp.]